MTDHHDDARARVLAVMRDHVATAYPAWKRRAYEPVPTRAGLRYLGQQLAGLLAPALEAVGLFVWEDYYGETRLFVDPRGRQWTRESVRDLVLGALADHPDRVLRASVVPSLWEHVADRLPDFEGDDVERVSRPESPSSAMTATERKRASRNRRQEAEEASARAFLDKARPLLEGSEIDGPDLYEKAVANIARRVEQAREGFASAFITDEDDSPVWTVPGKRLFYATADEVLGTRTRRSRGFVYIVRKIARRLKEATVNALTRAFEILGTGPSDPEEYADEACREIRDLAPANPPEVYDPRALTLPYQIAYAIAGVPDEDVVATFGRVARCHLTRHPEDRDAIAAVAVALRAGDPDDLVGQIRSRAASAIDAEEVTA